jgi:GTPase Era involved in 16S rRNA processing
METTPEKPTFAIVGHPNEGKSAVVSTLAEDDSVRVSPYPGETTRCRTFPVIIDGEEILRFVDTPGFQSPQRTLRWFQSYRGPEGAAVARFREVHRFDRRLQAEYRLLAPIEAGAGVIYVADGSRPLRRNDRMEMEILRLTGSPRMAVLNPKRGRREHLGQWKLEFRKHFNAVRIFNANSATFVERLALLEALKAIDQDWQSALETVVDALRADWQRRAVDTAELIVAFLGQALGHSVSRSYGADQSQADVAQGLEKKYRRQIVAMERACHQQIRRCFKHRRFDYELPEYSVARRDLFDRHTWRTLGLSPLRLAMTAALGGGLAGAALDTAAAGLTFGIFTAVGGALGAGSAWLGGERLARQKVVGLRLGGYRMTIGPARNIQLLFVLLDRALIYYAHMVNWAHGRRGYGEIPRGGKVGFVFQQAELLQKPGQGFFEAAGAGDAERLGKARKSLEASLIKALERIAVSKWRPI